MISVFHIHIFFFSARQRYPLHSTHFLLSPSQVCLIAFLIYLLNKKCFQHFPSCKEIQTITGVFQNTQYPSMSGEVFSNWHVLYECKPFFSVTLRVPILILQFYGKICDKWQLTEQHIFSTWSKASLFEETTYSYVNRWKKKLGDLLAFL